MVSEGAGDEVKMVIQKDNTTSVRAITLRVTGSLITNVLLIWSIQYGLELATQTETYIGDECNFNAGVITMVLGFVLMFVEIHILATMFLEFAMEQWKEQEEDNHQAGMYLELAENLEQQEDLEEKNDTYQGDGQYSIHHYLIKNVVGNVTALIGFCYITFGLGIAVDLSCMLQPKEKKGSSIHEEHNTNLECLV
ncbi:hypothetical protein SO802_028178 [Lithocarpus litseifolius]|uniref:Uncharacterized protein n=1 Tax=Lithocarpus litseifolius TaxID=425828 RepID=A0AAW2BPK1_9ROSI